MKIWYGQGSEHSAALVMLARFKDIPAAEAAKRAIERLAQRCVSNVQVGQFYDDLRDRYPEQLVKLLSEMNIGSIRPAELEQFLYEYTLTQQGDTVRIATDEVEISSFLKLFISMNAKIEVYSEHSAADDDSSKPTS